MTNHSQPLSLSPIPDIIYDSLLFRINGSAIAKCGSSLVNRRIFQIEKINIRIAR